MPAEWLPPQGGCPFLWSDRPCRPIRSQRTPQPGWPDMAINVTRHNKVAPRVPTSNVAVVGNRWLVCPDMTGFGAPSGNVTAGAIAVLDTLTLNETEYWSSSIGNLNRVIPEGVGSKAWGVWQANMSVSARRLWWLQPSTGTSDDIGVPSNGHYTQPLLVGGQIWLISRNVGASAIERFDLSTETYLSTYSGLPSIHSATWDGGSYVYVHHENTKITRITVSSGTHTSISGTYTNATWGGSNPLWHDGRMWSFRDGYWRVFDPAGPTLSVVGPNVGASTMQPALGADGDIHAVSTSGGINYICSIRPSDMAYRSDTLSTTAATVETVVSANGMLWTPTPEPLTR